MREQEREGAGGSAEPSRGTGALDAGRLHGAGVLTDSLASQRSDPASQPSTVPPSRRPSPSRHIPHAPLSIHLECGGPVEVLATLVLAGDHQARGQVRHADRRVCHVDVLPARACKSGDVHGRSESSPGYEGLEDACKPSHVDVRYARACSERPRPQRKHTRSRAGHGRAPSTYRIQRKAPGLLRRTRRS